MIIKRQIASHLKNLAKQFPVIGVMGPRQSGKTTLAKETFPDYAYVSLEDLDRRASAKEDPRGFFATYADKKGVIIDEIQEVPELFSYMQGIVDQAYKPGYFIVTGSQHFLMYEKITQTLAGRIALLTLLPLSIHELKEAELLPPSIEPLLLKGGYPRLYAQPFEVNAWVSNYISTYVEKDVRQMLKVSDVITFQKLIKLCAATVGNLLNYSNMARDLDISANTVKAWISILEASYIIKLLQPYHQNFNKRVIKTPKLYFYDTALVCFLLGIRTAEEFHLHPFKGAIFESFIISEMFKYNYNHNELPQIYFWRDTQGHEIDAIIEKSLGNTVPIEIKASMTITDSFFKGIAEWQEITKQPTTPYIIYAGQENMFRKKGDVFAWQNIDAMLKQIYQRS